MSQSQPKNEDSGSKLYPKQGRAKRAMLGGIFTIISEGINALNQIVLVPLYLWAWGKEVYGEWLTIYAMLIYLPLLDIGMQNYVVNSLTQNYANGNLKEYKKILHSALASYVIIVALGLFLLGFFVVFTPFPVWLNIIQTSSAQVKTASFLLGSYLLLSIPNGVINGVYNSIGEFPRRAVLIILQQIILMSLLICALIFKSKFVTLSILHFIPIAFIMVFAIYDISRRHPEIQYGFSKADWKYGLSFIHPSFLFLLITFSNLLKGQGSILILSTIIGSIAVAVFSIHRTLANMIIKIMGSMNAAIWPEITAADAVQDSEKMRRIYYILMKTAFFISISFAISLLFTGREIIALWTRGRIEFNGALWLVLMLYLPYNCLWETSGLFQIATNQHRTYALCKITSALGGCILGIIMTRFWGILGTISAFVISEFLICWLIPLKAVAIVRTKPSTAFMKIFVNGLYFTIPQIALGYLGSKYITPGIKQCCIIFPGVFLVGVILSYLFYFQADERQILKVWVARSGR